MFLQIGFQITLLTSINSKLSDIIEHLEAGTEHAKSVSKKENSAAGPSTQESHNDEDEWVVVGTLTSFQLPGRIHVAGTEIRGRDALDNI
ncbi:hypothetical protein EMCRGX_G033751 [Ephydatia muelleri]